MNNKPRDPLESLKPDLQRTLDLIGQGLSPKEIQDREQIGESGYYARIDRIYEALGIASLPRSRRWGELMAFARELGTPEPENAPPEEASRECEEPDKPPAPSPWLKRLGDRKTTAGLGLAAGVLLVLGASIVLLWKGNVAAVAITRPSDGAAVEYIDTVEGTAAGLRPGESVWVLITDADDNVYHPQVGPAARVGEHGWRVVGVRFGEERTLGIGKRYRISVAVAGPPATSTLDDYLDAGRQSGSFPGLRALPEGARLQAQSIVVQR